ncbi:MAG: hypothetical protein LBF60_10420 [Treponema sp.]|jgi:transposase-like protein|nr:hypothetical protein [Treponema sp.]
MDNKLAALINLVKHMPEKRLDQAIETLENREAEREEEQKPPGCPRCHAGSAARNGRRHGKRRCLRRECGKSFARTTGTAPYNSRSGEAAWKRAIRDTVDGTPIDQTAMSLGMRHKTVFNMRRKALFCLEGGQWAEGALSGVLEADERYILESLKGKEPPEGYWRAAGKRGAASSKGGISDEYICVRAAIERGGKACSRAVGRKSARRKSWEHLGEKSAGMP